MKFSPAFIPPLRYTHFGAYQIDPAVWFKEYRGQAAAFKAAPERYPVAYRGPMRQNMVQGSIAQRTEWTSSVLSSQIPVKNIYGLSGFGQNEEVSHEDITSLATDIAKGASLEQAMQLANMASISLINLLYLEEQALQNESVASRLIMNIPKFSNMSLADVMAIFMGKDGLNLNNKVLSDAKKARQRIITFLQDNKLSGMLEELPYEIKMRIYRFLEGDIFAEIPSTPATEGYGAVSLTTLLIVIGVLVLVLLLELFNFPILTRIFHGRSMSEALSAESAANTALIQAKIDITQKAAWFVSELIKERDLADKQGRRADYEKLSIMIRQFKEAMKYLAVALEKSGGGGSTLGDWIFAIIIAGGLALFYKFMTDVPLVETVKSIFATPSNGKTKTERATEALTQELKYKQAEAELERAKAGMSVVRAATGGGMQQPRRRRPGT